MADGKPLTSPQELVRRLRPDERLLGLDVGSKTLGVALSDVGRVVASPLKTIPRSRLHRDVEALKEIIQAYDIGGIVVGFPVNMDGSEGPRCQSVRQFAADLTERLDMAVAFWDERLSTRAVTRMLIQADLSRRRRGKVTDKVAAAYILQGALDSLRRP